MEYRNGENLFIAIMSRHLSVVLVPGAREKGIGKNPLYLYPDPALVSQGEKPKA